MALLVLLALAAALGLAASKGSSSSSSSGSPPPDSLPPKNGEKLTSSAPGTFSGDYVPVKNTARSASGRVYETWMWPPVAAVGGVYTVARLAGTTAWVAFTYNADANKSTPAKTNIMALQMTDGEKSGLLKSFAADWNLPQ